MQKFNFNFNSNHLAGILILSVSAISIITTVIVVNSDSIKKETDALEMLITAPNRNMEQLVAGILGFIGGAALEAKRNSDIENERIAALEEENRQLREF